jgi:hypothetical protein
MLRTFACNSLLLSCLPQNFNLHIDDSRSQGLVKLLLVLSNLVPQAHLDANRTFEQKSCTIYKLKEISTVV